MTTRLSRDPILTAISGASPVALGSGPFGWVSGAFASAAVSASVPVLFDLGENWRRLGLLQLTLKASQAVTSINGSWSENGILANAVAPVMQASGSPLSLVLSAAGSTGALIIPAARYLHVVVVNGTTAQAADSNVRLVSNP